MKFYSDAYSGRRPPKAGDHTTLAFTAVSAITASALPGGTYAFQPTKDCYLLLTGDPAGTCDATCRWVPAGGGAYISFDGQFYVAALRASTDDGTLHINRVG